ncbi:thymidylate synthase [Algiphilus sp. W345]|uniref:Thymidylate synthase n=1 Tax=Banduia mediterranea TaxID=3075609 RepID=A0ABU2WDV6_9GAMM|nr:thymidylate synthase [Algiphilus sp. W345]MDT0496055.1 thymidylate synthase [Algiphilus sp. W345]
MHPEQQYLELLRRLIAGGDLRLDRTGVGTRALFGYEMRFDLARGFPVFTTKRVYWKTAFKEMLWMLSGGRNIRELLQQNVRIWTDWPLRRYREETSDNLTQTEFEQRIVADADFAARWGDLGPVYGAQWRHWKTSDGGEIDQVAEVLRLLKENPSSRRIIWDAWNVAELDQMALPPCHKQYQFFVSSDGRLSGACIQRSVDSLLGLPFNIANLALVTHLLAEQSGYRVGEIVWYGLDVHLYSNHLEQARTQLERQPRIFPSLKIRPGVTSLFDYRIEDIDLVDYDPHPPISAEVAV